MRQILIASLLFVAACEGKEAVTPASDKVVVEPEMAKKLLEAVEKPSAPKVLNAPLPDDVKLDFPHNIVMETTRVVAGVQMHTVMLEPKVPVQGAVETLTEKFEAAGYKTTTSNAHTLGFSKGGTGEGMMAVTSGGTLVALTFNEFKAGNERIKDGVTGMVHMVVHSSVE